MKTIFAKRESLAGEAFRTRTFRPRYISAVLTATSLLSCLLASHADVVTDWNEIMTVTAAASPDPAARIRTGVITHVAVFEAVNSILAEYTPYLGRITAPSGASPKAAAVAAAHRVLTALHPENTARLDAARTASLAPISDNRSKTDGLTVGVAAADAILALRADDGFDGVVPYTPQIGPGIWQPTPPGFEPAFRPGLGQVATFGITNAQQFRADPPPALNSRKYARAYQEVKRLGDANNSNRPQRKTELARFYAISEPDMIYYPTARQVSAAKGKTLSENARIFALLSMAIWDGAVACFETKYHFNLWRPVTAIHAAHTDGNDKTDPDPQWRPLVFTLPFPSYPSGHASFGGAARAVLERMFGEGGHRITLNNPAAPEIVLHYTSFKQITDDIDEARVAGGVHFRFDQEAGAAQGKRVGEYILRHWLRPARQSDGD
jgi:hypothetical protein